MMNLGYIEIKLLMLDIFGKYYEVYEYNKLFNMVINLLDY